MSIYFLKITQKTKFDFGNEKKIFAFYKLKCKLLLVNQ